jgi:hypothetical protein
MTTSSPAAHPTHKGLVNTEGLFIAFGSTPELVVYDMVLDKDDEEEFLRDMGQKSGVRIFNPVLRDFKPEHIHKGWFKPVSDGYLKKNHVRMSSTSAPESCSPVSGMPFLES